MHNIKSAIDKLEPAYGSVLVNPVFGEDRTNWGVYLAADCWEGTVTAVSCDEDLVVGQRVLFAKESSVDLFRDGSVVRVKVDDILAIVKSQ